MKKILTITLALMVAMTFSFTMPQTVSAASKPGKIKKISGYTEVIPCVGNDRHSEGDDSYFLNMIADWSKSKNAKKYEFYRSASFNGKYRKIITVKKWSSVGIGGDYNKDGTLEEDYGNGDLIKLYGGLNWYKVRGINGSKKGTFSSKSAWYLYYLNVESVENNSAKTKTIIKVAVDNSKSKTPMYICTAEDGNKITFNEEIYDIDNDKTVSKKDLPFTYKFADENGSPITDESIIVPAKTITYLYMVFDSADVKTYWDAATDWVYEDWDDEEEELQYETYYRFNLGMNFYVLDGNKRVNFKTNLYTRDGAIYEPYYIKTVYSAK